MYFSGRLSLSGYNLMFARKESPKETIWYVFEEETIIDNKKYTISIEALKNLKLSSLKPFIIAGQKVTSESLEIFGNPNIISRLIKAYDAAYNSKYSSEEEKKDLTDDGLILTTTFKDDSSYIKIKTLYSEFKNVEVPESSEEVEASLKETSFFSKLASNAKDAIISEKSKKSKSKKIVTVDSIKFKDKIISIDFKHDDIEMNTLFWGLTGGKNISLPWEPVKLEPRQMKERMDSIHATLAKSISQLRINYDLSWFFNSKGKMRKNYKIVNTLEDLTYYCTEVFPKLKMWGVDIESTGLKMYGGENRSLFDHTVSIMVSWEKDQALFFPIDMEYIPNLPEGWDDLLKPHLERIKAVGHNIIFDARGLKCDFGINLNIAHDTMVLNFNVNCHRAKFLGNSLKKLEHRYFNIDTLELKNIFGSSKMAGLFRFLSPELALLYACPDVDYVLQLLYILWDELPVTARKGYKLDMQVAIPIYRMDCIGNKINTQKAIVQRKANNTDRELLSGLIYKIAGQTIAKRRFMDDLAYLFSQGLLKDEEIDEKLEEFFSSKEYKNATRIFDISSTKQLGEVMFKEMGYPIQELSKKTGLPELNANTLKKLLSFKEEVPKDEWWLKRDVKSAMQQLDSEAKPLIIAKKFAELKYPLASLIVEYRLREKRDNTFYHQVIDSSIGGRYYTSTKQANAETFRIINVIQTLQGIMKELVVPYDEDHYMIVFDFNQIEYRTMAGLGKAIALIKKLNNSRADFHKECVALMHNIAAWMVTKAMRSDGKSLNFAIPYGMGIYSICTKLYEKITELNLIKAQKQLNLWISKFKDIWDFLESKREFAIENGYVENTLGRRRYFFDGSNPNVEVEKENLKTWKESETSKRTGSIRRAAGNFPIQSEAADIFKLALINLSKRLESEGLGELVKITALIHDEMVCSVHKSVNKYFMYKLIYEEVMMTIPGHPRYFAGISIVENWHEGKEDLYEAPVEFVENIIKTGRSDDKFVYQEDAKNEALKDIYTYMDNVFIKEFTEIGVDFNSDMFDLSHVIDNTSDYFLIDKMSLYYQLPKDGSKGGLIDKYDEDKFIRSFEEFILKHGKHESYTIIYPDNYPLGKYGKLTKTERVISAEPDMDKNSVTTFFTFKDKIVEEIKDETPEVEESFQETDMLLNLDLELDSSIYVDSKSTDDLLSLNLGKEDDDKNDWENGEFESDSLTALFLYESLEENEDGDLFNDSGVSIGSVDYSEYKARMEAEEKDPNSYFSREDFRLRVLKVSSVALYVNVELIEKDGREELMNYINSFIVEKGTLGSVQVVLRLGTNINETGVFIKDYDIEVLRNMLEKYDKSRGAQTVMI